MIKRGRFNSNIPSFARCFKNCSFFEERLPCPGALLTALNAIKSQKTLLGGGQWLMSLVELPFVLLYLYFIIMIGGHLVWVPLLSILLIVAMTLCSRQQSEFFKKKLASDDKIFNLMNEIFEGLHTIKTHAMESLMLRRYERLRLQHSQCMYEALQYQYRNEDSARLIHQGTLVMLVTLGAFQVMAERITLGSVAACVLLVSRMLQPVTNWLRLYERLQQIDIEKKHHDRLMHLPSTAHTLLQVPAVPEIKFCNVGICFGNRRLFEKFNSVIQSGELI